MIRLRAHHLLCLSSKYATKGNWYDEKLTKHALNLRKIIIKNSKIKIKILKRCDDICKKCPHRKGKICRKREKINYWILIQDNKVLKKLKIKENSVYESKDIFSLAIKEITNKDLKEICRGCEFLPNCLKYGFNESLC